MVPGLWPRPVWHHVKKTLSIEDRRAKVSSFCLHLLCFSLGSSNSEVAQCKPLAKKLIRSIPSEAKLNMQTTEGLSQTNALHLVGIPSSVPRICSLAVSWVFLSYNVMKQLYCTLEERGEKTHKYSTLKTYCELLGMLWNIIVVFLFQYLQIIQQSRTDI